MASSYEEINYSLRPAKQIERKMICEAIKRLADFGTIETYRYIGFGSIYFSDFSLFHRRLNISDMLSIEKDVHKRARFEFNRPFECIELQFGKSTEILPSIIWDQRSILWLDYDGRLDGDALADIGSFCANAVSGSMLIVTVNAHFAATEKDRIAKLRTEVGNEMIPIDLEEHHLAGWNAANAIRRIVSNAIERHLNARNGGRRSGSHFLWKQILSFEYADGAKMTTIGGVLIEQGHEALFDACNFSGLEFNQPEPEGSYRIDIPALTYRELRYLDQRLPRQDFDGVETNGIPARDLKEYIRLYRYFPNFAEAEL